MIGLGSYLKEEDNKLNFYLTKSSGFQRLLFRVIRLLLMRPGTDPFFPEHGVGLYSYKETPISINFPSLLITFLTEKIEKIKDWLLDYSLYFNEPDPKAKLKDIKVLEILVDEAKFELIFRIKIETEEEVAEITL